MSEAEVRGALCDEKAEEEGLWGTIAVFVALFLLSVCYSATVTFFKVRGRDFRWEGLPVGGGGASGQASFVGWWGIIDGRLWDIKIGLWWKKEGLPVAGGGASDGEGGASGGRRRGFRWGGRGFRSGVFCWMVGDYRRKVMGYKDRLMVEKGGTSGVSRRGFRWEEEGLPVGGEGLPVGGGGASSQGSSIGWRGGLKMEGYGMEGEGYGGKGRDFRWEGVGLPVGGVFCWMGGCFRRKVDGGHLVPMH